MKNYFLLILILLATTLVANAQVLSTPLTALDVSVVETTLNFSKEEMREGILYAKEHNVKVFIAINTYPRANNVGVWEKAIDDAYECGFTLYCGRVQSEGGGVSS